MNWKQALFWVCVGAVLFYYFLLFGVFLFVRQEEMQLFVPAWWNVRAMLARPGGFCEVAGQWLIQYYRQPMWAVLFHTGLLVGCGYLIDGLSRVLSGGRSYLSLLTLCPVLYLARMSVRGEYLIDGTVGLLLMLLALQPLRGKRRSAAFLAGYGLGSTLLVAGCAGLLSVGYALVYALFAALRYPGRRERLAAAVGLLPVSLICLFSGWLGIPVPLWEGWRAESYLEIQLQPHYYINRVWTIFSLLLITVLILARLLPVWERESRWRKQLLFLLCSAALLLSAAFCRPEPWQAQRMMQDELAFLAREGQWDAIIRKHVHQPIHNYVSLNYLNMSLARKGELAERMFAFDQKGVKSLYADWNQTFYMDRLLSDVRFLVGDLALSEGLAMDGFTQAKRHGSAPMMQRLTQISLLRGDSAVAGKYLKLLAAMPFYRDWAARYTRYLTHPERMAEEPELAGKRFPDAGRDRLGLSLADDSLWCYRDCAHARIAWEYAGCHYLLAKNLEGFARFLEKLPFAGDKTLPCHFQEAVLLLAERGDEPGGLAGVQPEVRQRFEAFKQALRQSARQGDALAVRQAFGDTYWFYYYFKLFKGEKR